MGDGELPPPAPPAPPPPAPVHTAVQLGQDEAGDAKQARLRIEYITDREVMPAEGWAPGKRGAGALWALCAAAVLLDVATLAPPPALQARHFSAFTYCFSIALFVSVCVLVYLKYNTDETDVLFKTKDL